MPVKSGLLSMPSACALLGEKRNGKLKSKRLLINWK